MFETYCVGFDYIIVAEVGVIDSEGVVGINISNEVNVSDAAAYCFKFYVYVHDPHVILVH